MESEKSSNALAKAIITESYDIYYLRIAEYSQYRYLYFYAIKDDKIPFGTSREKYLIFSSNNDDPDYNIERVNVVRSSLIDGINLLISENKERIQNYKGVKTDFDRKIKTLHDRLLKVKYSTKLVFVKERLLKKCTLT